MKTLRTPWNDKVLKRRLNNSLRKINLQRKYVQDKNESSNNNNNVAGRKMSSPYYFES